MTFPPTQRAAPRDGSVKHTGPSPRESSKVGHTERDVKISVENTFLVNGSTVDSPVFLSEQHCQKHHSTQPVGEGLRKRLKNVTNLGKLFL